MLRKYNMLSTLVLAGGMLLATSVVQPVLASVVGIAVSGIGSNSQVGGTVDKPGLGGQSVKFYIPLTASPTSCTYGVNCGTSADTGSGGTVMSMYLRFSPVSNTSESKLQIKFKDLDVSPVNDPTGFLESVQVFNDQGSALTGKLESLGGALTGNMTHQTLIPLSLGMLVDTTLYVRLAFSSSSPFSGENSPEYLRAIVTPLPASAFLLLAALGGLGAVRARAKARQEPKAS